MHQVFILEDSSFAKEVLIRQKDDDLIFQFAEGTANFSRRDNEFPESVPKREPTVRSEDLSGEGQGESGESQPAGTNR